MEDERRQDGNRANGQGPAAEPWWMRIDGKSVSDLEDLYDHFHVSKHQKALENTCKRVQRTERHVQTAISQLNFSGQDSLMRWQNGVDDYLRHRQHVAERYARKGQLGQLRMEMEMDEVNSSSEDEADDRLTEGQAEDKEAKQLPEVEEAIEGDEGSPTSEPPSPTSSTASPSTRTPRRLLANKLRTGVKLISLLRKTRASVVGEAPAGGQSGNAAASRKSVSIQLPNIGDGASVVPTRPSNVGKGIADDALISPGASPRASNSVSSARPRASFAKGSAADDSPVGSAKAKLSSAVKGLAKQPSSP